jgi:hypothetical protein
MSDGEAYPNFRDGPFAGEYGNPDALALAA